MTSEKNELIGNFEISEGRLKTRREVLMMGALAAGGAVVASAAQAQTAVQTTTTTTTTTTTGAPAAYKQKDFTRLLEKPMAGLTKNQIEQHLKLYGGYVGKINQIQADLNTVDLAGANATYAPLRELLLEQSYALNGVVYHELYFGNLGGIGGEPTGDLLSAIDARWGNVGKFMDFFKASGKSMRGWVIVGWNTRDAALHAYGLDMHNMWVPANVIPVVVLDVYEHAYMIDYGINRGGYLDAFLKNIDWNVCNARLNAARKQLCGPESTV